MAPGDRLTVHVEKAIAGGRMLARHEGAVVLVAGAIPGETVDAEIQKVQRGTMWAETRRVLESSPDRHEPFCDGACGGTVYAHIAYRRQLDLKRDILRDAFLRLAHLELPDRVPVAASEPNGYRMRARLHARHRRLGFFREGTHELCDPAATRQLLPETLETLRRLEGALVRAARSKVTDIELAENREATERACHLVLADDGEPSQLSAVANVEGLSGVSCGSARGSHALTICGEPTVSDVLRGVTLSRHARAFFQGNRYLLEDLATQVVSCVPPGRAADLYAGVGLFSTTLAARGDTEVVAVEGDVAAAADLKRNAVPFGSSIVTRREPVEAFTDRARADNRFDCVIVDPPRTGMTRQAVQDVVRLGAQRVVYVSCDVATLARDARTLVDHGYRLGTVEAFDMFPNTAHVETVAVFNR